MTADQIKAEIEAMPQEQQEIIMDFLKILLLCNERGIEPPHVPESE